MEEYTFEFKTDRFTKTALFFTWIHSESPDSVAELYVDDVEIYEGGVGGAGVHQGPADKRPLLDSAKPTAGTTGAAEKSGDFPVVWIVVIVVAAVLAGPARWSF